MTEHTISNIYELIGNPYARKILPMIPVKGEISADEIAKKSGISLSATYKLLRAFLPMQLIEITRFSLNNPKKIAYYRRLITILNIATSVDGYETSRDLLDG